MEQHVFECRQIEEGERRLRHVVEKEDVTRLLDRGVGVSDVRASGGVKSRRWWRRFRWR